MCYPISVSEMRKAMEKLEQMGHSNHELLFEDDDNRILSICTSAPDVDITECIEIREDTESICFSKEKVRCIAIGEVLQNPEENWVGNNQN